MRPSLGHEYRDALRRARAAEAASADPFYDTLALAGPAHLLPDDEGAELLAAALAKARALDHPAVRAQALAFIADRDPAVFDEALATVTAIRSEEQRGELLALELAAVATDEAFPALVAAIGGLTDEFYRHDALESLPRVPATAAGAALRLAIELTDDVYRCHTIASLVPFLPETLLSEVLLEVLTWPNPRLQKPVLTAVATHAPASLEDDVRYVISEMREPLAAQPTQDAAPTNDPAEDDLRLALAGAGDVSEVQAVLARALDVDHDTALAVYRSVLASATCTELQIMTGRLATVAEHLGGINDVRAIVAAVREDQAHG